MRLTFRQPVRGRHLQSQMGAIHSTKILIGPTGKSGPPQKVDPFIRNFSGWTEPIQLSFGLRFPEILVEWIAPKGVVPRQLMVERKWRDLEQEILNSGY